MIQADPGIRTGKRRVCAACRTEVPKDAAYCIICGHGQIMEGIPVYALPGIIRFNDQTGQFDRCVRCGNSEHKPGTAYCRICGAPLTNLCIPLIGRKHYNSSNALFCAVCGSRTVFNASQIHAQKKEVKTMIYSDGVPYDKNTMKVRICPRCRNEEFSDSSDYCRICGTNLFNLCEGEPSYNQKNGEYIGPSNQHKNPSNARFCEKCGKTTVYFKNKILKDYIAVLNPSHGTAEEVPVGEEE